MVETHELLELLVADLAVTQGRAEPRDVAEAIRRYWEKRASPDASLGDELIHNAGVPRRIVAELRSLAEKKVDEEDGEPDSAWSRRGGLAPALRASLAALAPQVVAELAASGMDSPTPLRIPPDGRYVDFSLVAEGGMGIVYETNDQELGRGVAFKTIRGDGGAGDGEPPERPLEEPPTERDTQADRSYDVLTTRLLQEALVTGGLEHPGIVPVYEIGQTEAGVPYYTMRFIRGQRTLATELDRLCTALANERMRLLEQFLRVCDTMRYAHSRHVTHRDLKPENIALGDFGEVILLDWGLAKVENAADPVAEGWQQRIGEMRSSGLLKTVAGAIGTPGYMSPEAALGRHEDLDHRSDVYSLGAILYEILTGRLPFEFESYAEYVQQVIKEDAPHARDVDPAIPQELGDLCARALAREPEDRPHDAGALADALRSWQARSVVAHEADRLLADALASLDTAEALQGTDRLRQVDRSMAAVEQVLARRPDSRAALEARSRAEDLREAGIREREHTTRTRALRRLALVVLVLAAIGGIVVSGILNQRRQEAVRARQEATMLRQQEGRLLLETQTDLGRRELLAEDPVRALTHLLPAYEKASLDPTLQFLVARATAYLEAQRLRLDEHDEPLRVAAFRPDGEVVVTAGLGGSVRIFDAENGTRGGTLEGHVEAVRAIAFSHDESRLVTAGADDFAILWDLATGRAITRLEGHVGGIESAQFSHDDRWIVTAGEDGTARIWNADSGTAKGVFRGHRGALSSARFGPQDRWVLTAGADGTARLWDANTGAMCHLVAGHEGGTVSAVFDADAARFVTAGVDRMAHVWSVDSDRPLLTLAGHRQSMVGASYSPDGARILTWSLDRTARIWDAETGAMLRTLEGHTHYVTSARFSPDGEHVVTAGADGTVRLWATESGTSLMVFRGHSMPVLSVSFDATGMHIVSASDDRTARVWNARARNYVTRMAGHKRPVAAAVFAPESRVLTWSDDGTARLWDMPYALKPLVFTGHAAPLLTAALLGDGDSVLVTVGRDGIRTTDAGDPDSAHSIAHGAGPILAADISSDGSWIGIGTDDGAQLIDVKTGDRVSLPGVLGPCRSIAFAQDGLRAVTVGPGGTLHVSPSLRDGGTPRELPSPQDSIERAVFSPHGNRILTTGGSRAYLLMADTGAPVTHFSAHISTVNAAVFSAGGRLVVSASRDGTAKVWESATGKMLADLRGHDGPVNTACFGPRGVFVATGGDDGTARIWSAATGALLATLRGHTAPVLHAVFGNAGSSLLTTDADGTALLWDTHLEKRDAAEIERLIR